jgi:hypothetical protein
MSLKNDEEYSDFSNVEAQEDFLATEEFPEGSFGSSKGKTEAVKNKSTPWEDGQQYTSGFTYENRTLHKDIPRQFPGAHPTHYEKEKDKDTQSND